MPHNTPARRAFLHVGTHKTGTTSIQAFIAMNAPALATAGIFVPRAGRPASRWGSENVGHHNLAWELNGIDDFRRDEGTFDDALREIERSGAGTVVLSSEDLEWLHDKPPVMERVRDDLRGLGYETTVIVYLRAQPEYITAMYTENAKAGFLVNFGAVLESILEDGAWIIEHPRVRMAVDYEPLVDAFAAVFGSDRVVVRPYRAGRAPTQLLVEFLGLIGADALPVQAMLRPAMMNPSPTLAEVIDGLFGAVRRADAGAATPTALFARELPGDGEAFAQRKFDAMSQAEIHRVYERFAESNRSLQRRFGGSAPMQSESDLKVRSAVEWESVAKQRKLLEAAEAAWRITARTK